MSNRLKHSYKVLADMEMTQSSAEQQMSNRLEHSYTGLGRYGIVLKFHKVAMPNKLDHSYTGMTSSRGNSKFNSKSNDHRLLLWEIIQK